MLRRDPAFQRQSGTEINPLRSCLSFALPWQERRRRRMRDITSEVISSMHARAPTSFRIEARSLDEEPAFLRRLCLG